jgi:hypothetical protein
LVTVQMVFTTPVHPTPQQRFFGLALRAAP